MLDFMYYSPTKVYFGKWAVNQLGNALKEKGFSNVLLHYGGGSIKKNGVYDAVVSQLNGAGIRFVELGGVEANPKIGLIREGVEICKEQGIDFILAVGGGSVIDSAKAIAMGAKLDFDVWEMYVTTVPVSDEPGAEERPSRRGPIKEALPLGSVLTISAAGSELSDGTVVSNPDRKLKRDYGNPNLRPMFAFMNPEFTFTVSKYQTACGTVDIMMHTLERYFTRTPNVDLTDEIAEGLLRSVIKAGKIAVENGEDYEARATLMWASSISHNDLTGVGRASDWSTHQLEHDLSGMYDFVSHGAGLSAIFPAWCKYVWREDPARFCRYAEKVWGISPEGKTEEELVMAGIAATEEYFASLGMPIRLSQLNIGDEHIDEMAYKCSFGEKRTLGGFKRLQKDDMAAIYRLAL